MNKETLEEAAKKYVKNFAPSVKSAREIGFLDGSKWQIDKQDEFAIGFAEWLLIIYNEDIIYDAYTKKELLEIYKKEKGL